MGQSGRQLGKIAVQNLNALIDEYEKSGRLLPLRKSGEALHLGNICKAVGVVRTTVNTNREFRETLKLYAKEKGIAYSLAGRVAAEEDDHVTEGVTSAPSDFVDLRLSYLVHKQLTAEP